MAENETMAPAAEQQQEAPATPNYDEMVKTDKTFQSWLDAKITQASSTAVQNYQKKQERLSNERLTEAEKLKGMSDSEKAEYYRRVAEEREQAFERFKNAGALRTQTVQMLGENKVPLEFLDQFDFERMTADDVKARVDLFSKFEIYPKGTFDERVKAALDEKLRQKPPETHAATNQTDNATRAAFGLPPI